MSLTELSFKLPRLMERVEAAKARKDLKDLRDCKLILFFVQAMMTSSRVPDPEKVLITRLGELMVDAIHLQNQHDGLSLEDSKKHISGLLDWCGHLQADLTRENFSTRPYNGPTFN